MVSRKEFGNDKVSKISSEQAKIELKEPRDQLLSWERELRMIANLFAVTTVITLPIYIFELTQFLTIFVAILFTLATVGLIFLQRQISFIAKETEKTVIGGNMAILGLFILEIPLISFIVDPQSLIIVDLLKLLLMVLGGVLILIGGFTEATSYDEFITRYMSHNKLHSTRLIFTVFVILSFFWFPASFLWVPMLLLFLTWLDKFLIIFYQFVKWIVALISSMIKFIANSIERAWNFILIKSNQTWKFLLKNKKSFFRLTIFSIGNLLITIAILTELHSLALLCIGILVIGLILLLFSDREKKTAGIPAVIISAIFSLITIIFAFTLDLGKPFPLFLSTGWIMLLAGIVLVFLAWVDFIGKMIIIIGNVILAIILTILTVITSILITVKGVLVTIARTIQFFFLYTSTFTKHKPLTTTRCALSALGIVLICYPFHIFLPIFAIISLVSIYLWLQAATGQSRAYHEEKVEDSEHQEDLSQNHYKKLLLTIEEDSLNAIGIFSGFFFVASVSIFILHDFINSIVSMIDSVPDRVVLLTAFGLIIISVIDYIIRFIIIVMKKVANILMTVVIHFKISLSMYASSTRNMVIKYPGRYIKGTGSLFAVSLLLFAFHSSYGPFFYFIIEVLFFFAIVYDTVMYRQWLQQRTLSNDENMETNDLGEEKQDLLSILFWDPLDTSLPRPWKFDEKKVFNIPIWIFVCMVIATVLAIPVYFLLSTLGTSIINIQESQLLAFGMTVLVLFITWIVEIVRFSVKAIKWIFDISFQLMKALRDFIMNATRWLIDSVLQLMRTVRDFTQRHTKRIIQTSISIIALMIILLALFIWSLEPIDQSLLFSLAIVILLFTWIMEIISYARLTGMKVKDFISRMITAIIELFLRFIRALKTSVVKIKNAIHIFGIKTAYFTSVFFYYLVDYIAVYLINLLAIAVFIFGVILFASGLLPDDIRTTLIDPLFSNTVMEQVYNIFSPTGKEPNMDAYKLVDVLVGLGMLAVPVWIVYITLTRRNKLKISLLEKPSRPVRIGGIDLDSLREALETGTDIQHVLKGKYPPGTVNEIITVLGDYRKYNLVTDFLNSGNTGIIKHAQEILYQGLPSSVQDLLEYVFNHPITGYLAIEILLHSDNPAIAEYLESLIAKSKVFLPAGLKIEVRKYLSGRNEP
ncbi:MAG: hypothetical protein ACXAEU_10830 [Candidatus Hodarchaeales archaeon]|jgi:hypothetical protein